MSIGSILGLCSFLLPQIIIAQPTLEYYISLIIEIIYDIYSFVLACQIIRKGVL